MAHRFWGELTTADFAGLDPEAAIAVLPVAAIEQHGPHLPVITDTAIAEGMISEVVRRAPHDVHLLILPAQAVGKSNEHLRSPGTLSRSVRQTSAPGLGRDRAVLFAARGVRKLIIVTSHGGNLELIGIVARDLRVTVMLVMARRTRFR
jgi:creatinine amidohydrolase